MESDAIVEGFTRSIAMHGVIFKTLIADSDSNSINSLSKIAIRIESK